MFNWKYIAILFGAVVIFNSCVNRQENFSAQQTQPATNIHQPYGAYVAGRVAHLRRDYNSAADYYIKAVDADPNNTELLSSVYLILASQSRVDEAAQFAKKSLAQGDKNSFAYIIIAAADIKQKQYAQALKNLDKTKGEIYDEFINPLLAAWAYAGENKQKEALKTLDKIKNEPGLRALYHFHAGMINEYFNDYTAAQKNYEVIVNEEQLEMSFRSLQVITNFYILTNQKDKAVALVSKYVNDKSLSDMMRRLKQKVLAASVDKTQKLISTPQMGTAEAFFNIAATLRQGAGGLDLAHMFISLAIYENPKYDLARLLLADILESREMYAEANQQYDQIDNSCESYYSAQLKKANNLVTINDYKGAELLMKSLTIETQNPQLYLDLGDVLRINGNQKEAIKYYTQAINALPSVQNNHWVLYYARGISYEQNGQWNLAEKDFLKALKLSQNHYMVLNYLGYSWIKQGKNTELAFSMIVDAYNQSPQDGNVADSLGWAFYRLGKYDQAVIYLEKAAELEPANAVISDHLGDAYWQVGRKNEARFQWQHALSMKDETNELDKDAVKAKLQTGEVFNTPLKFNAKEVQEKADLIATED